MNLTCSSLVTNSEGVSFISRVTPTGWEMVGDGALGLGATDSRTGVPTLVFNTGQVTRTLLVDGTLGLALNVRVALEAGQAGAGRGLVPLSADGVQSAGTGPAGICPLRQGCSRYELQSDLWTEEEGNISLNFLQVTKTPMTMIIMQ